MSKQTYLKKITEKIENGEKIITTEVIQLDKYSDRIFVEEGDTPLGREPVPAQRVETGEQYVRIHDYYWVNNNGERDGCSEKIEITNKGKGSINIKILKGACIAFEHNITFVNVKE